MARGSKGKGKAPARRNRPETDDLGPIRGGRLRFRLTADPVAADNPYMCAGCKRAFQTKSGATTHVRYCDHRRARVVMRVGAEDWEVMRSSAPPGDAPGSSAALFPAAVADNPDASDSDRDEVGMSFHDELDEEELDPIGAARPQPPLERYVGW